MPLRPFAATALAALLGTLAEAKTVHIDIRELGFEPADATAEVGDTVEWSNADFVAHTATGENVFDVEIPPGAMQRVKLDRAGSIDYLCRFHPNMRATITVKQR
jgi:plastocyanin